MNSEIDILLDEIIGKFNSFIKKNKVNENFLRDVNFVKYQQNINNVIDNFIKKINLKDKTKIFKIENNLEYFIELIKKYLIYYIYMSISINYRGGKDLYITNVIETSKNSKNMSFKIKDFNNSKSNSKLNEFYDIINNIINLDKLRTLEKVKNLIENNPINFDSTNNFINKIGYETYINYILNNEDRNFNTIKLLIIHYLYLIEDKNNFEEFIYYSGKKEGEYRYIDIILSNTDKDIDYNSLLEIFSRRDIDSGYADDVYNFIIQNDNEYKKLLLTNIDKVNYLFENKIIYPICEDFLRYHKNTELYDSKKDESKIKMILNKIDKVRNYYSSVIVNNPKLKLDIKKIFYNVLPYRDIILFNKNEELKIKYKSKNMGHTFKDNEILLDLENISKYLYVNFKDASKDSIKIRPNKHISAIRYTNIKYRDHIKKETPLETRIGSKYLDLNIVGVAFSKNNFYLDNFKIKDLMDKENIIDKSNNYKKFLSLIKNLFYTKDNTKKVLYWLFNIKYDKPIINNFFKLSNKLSVEENFYILLGDFYDFINNLTKKYLEKVIINNINSISIKDIDRIITSSNNINIRNNKDIRTKIYNYYLYQNKLNLIKNNSIFTKIKIREKGQIINLPEIKLYKKEKIIKISQRNDKIETESNIIIHKCQHYIDWEKIKRIKNNPNEFTQSIFDFVKKYVKTNKKSDFICKSCYEMLAIKKYVYEGSYDPNADIYYTTNLAITTQLKKIPQYQKYSRIINNLDTIIDSMALTINNISLFGGLSQIKVRRQGIVKDIIDLILLHTVFLKKEGKTRIDKIEQTYGINRNNTNLFFFELKDDIFITSSNDTDYYKIIKYNNIISYLIFILISDINEGIILNLKEFKKCSYFLYTRYAKGLFNNIYLRISIKDKIPINKFPILCYLLYYFSFVIIEYKIWNIKNSNNNEFNFIQTQKTVIGTIIDLINGIIEINFTKSKNYLYEILGRRFLDKLSNIYKNDKIIKKLEIKSNKLFKIDEKTKKISYLTKINKTLKLLGNFDPNINYLEINKNKICDSKIKTSTDYLNNNKDIDSNKLIINKKINKLTNCSDGKFHKWVEDRESSTLICQLCNKSFNNILEKLEKKYKTCINCNDTEILQNIYYINLNKLTTKFCLDGNIHEFKNNICTKCKVNKDKVFSRKELDELEKNLSSKSQINITNKINESKIKMKNKINSKELINKKVNYIKNIFDKESNSKIPVYIDKLLEKFRKLGDNIKFNNLTYHLYENIYVIDHDYLGNKIKDSIYIKESSEKIKIKFNHYYFKTDVIYYLDKNYNVFVFYDKVYKVLLGYQEKNKEIVNVRSNNILEIIPSIKNIILNLGLETQYYKNNIIKNNNKFNEENSEKNNKENSEDVLNQINFDNNIKDIQDNMINKRISLLKQSIIKIKTILNIVKNEQNEKRSDEYSVLKNITIKNILLENDNFTLFDNYMNFSYLNNINNYFDNIKINNYNIDQTILNELNNNDVNLLFYIIYNFIKIIDINKDSNEIIYIVIIIIIYLYNINYIPNNNIDLKKFNIYIDSPILNIIESNLLNNKYSEVLTENQVNNTELENSNISDLDEDTILDNKEMSESLDIDDYDDDGDITADFDDYEID